MCACGHLISSHSPELLACFACAGPSCDVTFTRCAICGDWEYQRDREDTARHVRGGSFTCNLDRLADAHERLLETVAKRVERHQWMGGVHGAHVDHKYDAQCAICRGDIRAIPRIAMRLEREVAR